MMRRLMILAACASLAGCGLAETAAVSGTVAAGEAEQAKQAKQQMDQVKADLAASEQAAAEARTKAEAASSGE
jgi:hypothetical protein